MGLPAGRVTAHPRATSASESTGSQKSRLRTGIAGCKANTAARLATNINQGRQRTGGRLMARAAMPKTRMVARVI